MALPPVSWPWPPCFSSSSRCYVFTLWAIFYVLAIWRHPSASCSHPVLGLLADFLPPRLHSTILFWILLSNVLSIRPSHCNLFTHMCVARSLSLYSFRCFMFSIAINLYQSKHFPKDFSPTNRSCVRHPDAWTVVSSMKTHQAACCRASVKFWRIEVQYVILSWPRVPSPVRPVRRWQKQPSSYTNCVSCLSQLEVDCLPVSLLVCGSPAG